MGTFSTLGGATLAPKPPKLTRPQTILIAVFWTVYLVLAVGIALDDSSPVLVLLSPVLIPLVWGAVHLWQRHIRARLARLSWPGWLVFGVVGLMLSLVTVGATIGFGVRGRAASDLPAAASTLVFIGPWAGLLAAIWLVRRRWALAPYHAFWTLGAVGALTERGGLLPVALLNGDVIGALLLAVYLVPAYGVGVGAALGVMPENKLPDTKRQPTTGAFVTLVVGMWVFFAVFSAVWVAILAALFS